MTAKRSRRRTNACSIPGELTMADIEQLGALDRNLARKALKAVVSRQVV
jgi:hypothetical protein